MPVFTASLGSVTAHKWGRAYANEFPVAVADLDVDKLRTILQEAVGLLKWHNFGWKAFWDSDPDWSYLKLAPSLRVFTLAFALQLR
jgi:hypothetical protein